MWQRGLGCPVDVQGDSERREAREAVGGLIAGLEDELAAREEPREELALGIPARERPCDQRLEPGLELRQIGDAALGEVIRIHLPGDEVAGQPFRWIDHQPERRLRVHRGRAGQRGNERKECETCRAIDTVDGLAADCDLLDNGQSDGSCGCGNGVVDPWGEGDGGPCCGADCRVAGDGAACDDGVFCNGSDACNSGACVVHSGGPCPGPDGDVSCTESCNEGARSCTAPDPDGAPCQDGDVCTQGETCTAGACGGGFAIDCKRVFLSSTTHLGDLGGASGADTICKTLADTAGLAGDFRACVSDAASSPATRFTRASTPYVTTRPGTGCAGPGCRDSSDLRLIANDWADLTDGRVSAQIRYDELGTLIPGPDVLVWTGTEGDGTTAAATCGNWTNASSFAGVAGSPSLCCDGRWSNANLFSCAQARPLYCFEQ